MNSALGIFAGVVTMGIGAALAIALVLMVAYAFDRAAMDKQLDEMKAKATRVVEKADLE